jgi:hypothetical protein
VDALAAHLTTPLPGGNDDPGQGLARMRMERIVAALTGDAHAGTH